MDRLDPLVFIVNKLVFKVRNLNYYSPLHYLIVPFIIAIKVIIGIIINPSSFNPFNHRINHKIKLIQLLILFQDNEVFMHMIHNQVPFLY